MKKLISVLLLVAVMATLLTACGSFTCGLCKKEKSGKKYDTEISGQAFVICKDCHDGLEELAEAFQK